MSVERLAMRARAIWAYYQEGGIMLRWGSNVAWEMKRFVLHDHITSNREHLEEVVNRLEKCMQAEIDIQLLGVDK